MPALLVSKSPPLSGEVTIHGAKNSVLPILAATLLCRTPCVLHNCPDILDVTHTRAILHSLGCASERRGASVYIDPRSCAGHSIPPELAASMRASSLFLGALLARQGEASLSLPGGCPIGARPVDYHLLAFRALGAEVTETDDTIHCRARRLTGAKITLPGPSVGATENLLLAAARAKGTTVLTNAAREPEIEDLAGYLNRCGAHIHGAGESCIVIEGVPHLYGSTYTVMPDRIAAATYMAAAAVTGGTVLLRDVNSEHLLPVLSAFESTGCAVMQSGSELLLRAPQRLKPVRHVRTMPYPGFPTDAQAPVMTMAAVGDGTSIFVENIFESRYKHAGELNRLGAKIKLEGKVAVIEGVPQLSGAPVSAEDLRGGAALVIAGLAAQGETQVMHPQYIDRGYAHFEENLRALGADVYRI